MNEQSAMITCQHLLVVFAFIMLVSLLCGGLGPAWGWPNGRYGAYSGLVICLILCIFKLVGWI